MTASAASSISPAELRQLLQSSTPPRLLDVRTPAEYETAHIAGSDNVPLDVLNEHRSEVASHLGQDRDVVLVCRSGQRSAKADGLLRGEGLTRGRVLDEGLVGWEAHGSDVDRGVQRWDLERQVRFVAGTAVLSSVLASIGVPKLKWLAAAVGGGLTYTAVTNTCAMATALSKLPYSRAAAPDSETILARLG